MAKQAIHSPIQPENEGVAMTRRSSVTRISSPQHLGRGSQTSLLYVHGLEAVTVFDRASRYSQDLGLTAINLNSVRLLAFCALRIALRTEAMPRIEQTTCSPTQSCKF